MEKSEAYVGMPVIFHWYISKKPTIHRDEKWIEGKTGHIVSIDVSSAAVQFDEVLIHPSDGALKMQWCSFSFLHPFNLSPEEMAAYQERQRQEIARQLDLRRREEHAKKYL